MGLGLGPANSTEYGLVSAQIGYRGAQKLRADARKDGVEKRVDHGIAVCWVCLAVQMILGKQSAG